MAIIPIALVPSCTCSVCYVPGGVLKHRLYRSILTHPAFSVIEIWLDCGTCSVDHKLVIFWTHYHYCVYWKQSTKKGPWWPDSECPYCDWIKVSPIARFMGPTWGPFGADRTQVGPMLDPWTLLSGVIFQVSARRQYLCKSCEIYFPYDEKSYTKILSPVVGFPNRIRI